MFDALIPVGIFILCLGGALAFVAMAYFLVSMVITIDRMMEKVHPLLTDIKSITEKAQPLMKKANPMVDRITLTIDAANLEIMRLDQVLEDVETITGNMAKASESVDTAASTPVQFAGTVSSKIREKIAGQKGAAGTKGVIFNAVDEGLSQINDKVAAYQVRTADRKVEQAAAAEARDAKQVAKVALADGLKKTVAKQINEDTK